MSVRLSRIVISRAARPFVGVLAALLICLAFAASCGGGSDGSSTPTTNSTNSTIAPTPSTASTSQTTAPTTSADTYSSLLTAFAKAASLVQDESLPGLPAFNKVDGCVDAPGLTPPCGCAQLGGSFGLVANCKLTYPAWSDVPASAVGVKQVAVDVQLYQDVTKATAFMDQSRVGLESHGVAVEHAPLGDTTLLYKGLAPIVTGAPGLDPGACQLLYLLTQVGVKTVTVSTNYCGSGPPTTEALAIAGLVIGQLANVTG